MRAPMLGSATIITAKPATIMTGRPSEKRFKLGAARVATPSPMLMNNMVTMIGKAISTASYFEIDDVVDPADTRRTIAAVLAAAPPAERRRGKKRPNIDTW